MDNRAYLERAGDYDVENEGKQRTMRKKAALIANAVEARTKGLPISILEVGCGTGLFTTLLATRFPNAHITATDAFAPMIEIAKQRLAAFPNVQLQHYDAEATGSFAERFDVVCGVDLIHHLNDPVAGLRSWRQVAAPGGSLVFFESNARNPVLYMRMRNRPEEARFKYNTRGNLTRWAIEAGWNSVRVEHVPIHLPNGPRALWPMVDRVENALHAALWPFSGGMLVLGTAG
jgi:SAM-dependent methyltransferase